MTMAALTELGHLWTTRLDRLQKERLVEFEKEFRKGWQMEKEGNPKGALEWYKKLEKEYEGLPQASKLATLQIRKIEEALASSKKSGPGKKKP